MLKSLIPSEDHSVKNQYNQSLNEEQTTQKFVKMSKDKRKAESFTKTVINCDRTTRPPKILIAKRARVSNSRKDFHGR